MRPRGNPPVPRAASMAMEPVEMTETGTMASFEPSRTIEPLPNCFSICPKVCSSARARSFSSMAIQFLQANKRRISIVASKPQLLHTIIGGFFGNNHVVDMAFPQTRRGDAYKRRLLLKLLDGAAAAITHARLHPAHQLISQVGKRALRRRAAFNTLRHQLLCGVERIAIRVAARHGAQRAHAAIGLKGAALIENRLAGALVGAGQQTADHDTIR